MKKTIIAALTFVMLGSAAIAQTPATNRTHSSGHRNGQSTTTTTTTDKQTKRDMNRGGHLNNGDNGDKNNSRGRGDKNNRQVK